MITANTQVTLPDDRRDKRQTHALDLVVKLLSALAREEIDYCHWKSNAAIKRSASGDNDLDLLVERADAQRFVEILYRHGFKNALLAPQDKLPGVLDFYGLDLPSGRLVHVHAHFQLVLGSDLSKGYRLPLERAYLASAAQKGLFRLPAPEFELVVFVIRMVLKHATWDTILLRHGSLSPSERRELQYLDTPSNLKRVSAILENHIPSLSRELFDACLHALDPRCGLRERVRTGHRLHKVLHSCARYPYTIDLIRKFTNRVGMSIQARVLRRHTKRELAGGGLLIAIVGGDGAGKTTALDALHTWLAGKFRTARVHMGKPSWSGATVAVRGLLKVGTLLRLYPFETVSEQEMYATGSNATNFPGYPALIRMVCTARDRYLTYLKARRFSSNGGIVLCDRYSFPGFMNMDGPQCARATQSMKSSWFINWMVKLEASCYNQILLPDLLIVLKVDPETAVRRKLEESETSVRARSGEVWQLDWERLPAHVIEADKQPAEILAEIKALVWSYL